MLRLFHAAERFLTFSDLVQLHVDARPLCKMYPILTPLYTLA